MRLLNKYTLLLILLFHTAVSLSQILVGGVIEGLGQDHLSGYSVDISNSGNRIAIGAIGDDILPDFSGYVRVMDFDGSNWIQVGSLIEGINDDDQAGTWVSISGNGEIVAVGAPRYSGVGNSKGHIRVFQWDQGDWSQLGQDIDGDFEFDEFGRSIDLNNDGSRMIIGNYQSDPNGFQSGLVKVYNWNGSNWEQLGQTIDGANEGDRTGEGVCINANGNRIAVGSPRSDVNGEASGDVKVYQLNGTQWEQLGQTIEGEGEINFTGASIDMNAPGDWIVVGEPQNGDTGEQAGQARVFSYDGTNWNQMGNDLNGEAAFDLYGISSAMNASGTVIGIGSYFNDGNGSAAGHARVFQWDGTDWMQIGDDIDGTETGDASAYSLSLNSTGERIIIGSPYNDDNGEDSGHVRVFSNDNLGVNSVNFDNDLKVIFHQSNEKLLIHSELRAFTSLNIYSIEGKKLKSQRLDAPKNYFEMECVSFPDGAYIVEVQDVLGNLSTRRFLKY